MTCPKCDGKTARKSIQHKIYFGKEHVVIPTVTEVCTLCGSYGLSLQKLQRFELSAAIVYLSDTKHLTGKGLRAVRSILGLKQRELVRLLDLGNEQISRYENQRKPLDNMLRLALKELCREKIEPQGKKDESIRLAA